MSAGVDDSTDSLIGRALRTEGGHLSIGRGGFSLHYDRGCTLSGYDCERMKTLCIARGLPVIDSRDVPFGVVWRLAINGPMIAVGHAAHAPPWHGLSDAPLRAVADAYRAAGAEVFNLATSPEGTTARATGAATGTRGPAAHAAQSRTGGTSQ